MNSRAKLFLTSFGLFALVGILAVGVLTVGKRVSFQNKAASGTGTAHITVTPETGNLTVGDAPTPVYFRFDTNGAGTQGVSIVALQFSYPYSGTTPELDFTDASGNPVNSLAVNPSFVNNVQFNTITRTGGIVTVTVGLTWNSLGNGYSTTTPVNIATAYLKPNAAGTKTLTFDLTNSTINTKSTGDDILANPINPSFTVATGTTPGVGRLIFTPSTTSINNGSTVTTNVTFNTGGTAVSSLAFNLSFPNASIDVVDSAGVLATQVTPSTAVTGSGDWSFPVKSVSRSGGVTTINFAAINSNTSGYTTSTDVALTSLLFRGSAVTTTPVTLTFGSTTSMLTKSTSPVEILQMPTNLSYSVAAPSGDTTNPTVSLTAPAGTINGTVTVSATASDNVGVTRVEFYAGTNLIGTTTTSPYNISWDTTTLTNGVYSLTAKAYDAANNVGTSTAVSVTVNNVPTLSFGFKMQGVTASLQKTFVITLKGSSTASYTNPLTSDSSGVFHATNMIFNNLPAGTYDVLVKGPNTLNKKLGTIALVTGVNTAPASWENVSLMVGDFDVTTGNANVFNILDIAKMLQNYTALTTVVTTTNGLSLYDVDNDGNYALRDIAMVLGNFVQLTLNGE